MISFARGATNRRICDDDDNETATCNSESCGRATTFVVGPSIWEVDSVSCKLSTYSSAMMAELLLVILDLVIESRSPSTILLSEERNIFAAELLLSSSVMMTKLPFVTLNLVVESHCSLLIFRSKNRASLTEENPIQYSFRIHLNSQKRHGRSLVWQ